MRIVEDPNEAFNTLFDSIDIYRLQKLPSYNPTIKSANEIHKALKDSAISKLKITSVNSFVFK